MALSHLIAGPILRRIENNKVSVWVAFSKQQSLTLNIYGDSKVEHSGSEDLFNTDKTILATGLTSTVQFGKNLFIAVITAEIPSPGLEETKAYSYNILMNSVNPNKVHDFKTQGLLDKVDVNERPQLPIGYAKNVLPTFIIPKGKAEDLIIAQGSCRKMHGYGDDALSYLDKIIEANVTDSSANNDEPRPQQLFLTGDQIYADDVAGLLLQYAGNADGNSLVGSNEKIQIRKNNGAAIEKLDSDTVNFPVYFRQHLLTEYAGFSSGAASCHLISFEEFCGTYLNYWSIRSWNIDFWNAIKEIKSAADDQKKTKIEALIDKFLGDKVTNSEPSLFNILKDAATTPAISDYVFPKDESGNSTISSQDNMKEALDKKRGTLRKEIKAIIKFADALPKVSRVLANIPCYMIFDDHEVTDDWNITKRWKNNVYSTPLGRDIIRNALMAYAVFQDWGNVPEEYVAVPQAGENTANLSVKTQFIRKVATYGERVGENQNIDGLFSDIIPEMETILGMNNAPPTIKWHYNVASGAGHTYVLDTRTRRQLEELNSAPGLIGETDLAEQLPAVSPNNNDFIFVVSAVPALGLASFEELIQPLGVAAKGIFAKGSAPGIVGGALEFDYESWGFHVPAFEGLLERLSKHQKVILLSGDVHYGFSSVLDYWTTSTDTPTSRMIQLTSSACKNQWLPNVTLFKQGLVQHILASFDSKLEKVGWKDKVLSATGDGYVSPRNRTRLRSSIAVVPVAGWEEGVTLNHQPDFRWRLAVVADKRVREGSLFTADIDLDNPASVTEGYKLVVQRHVDTFVGGVTRRSVWPANIGIIKFEGSDADLKVKHEFYYAKGERGADTPKVGMQTQHIIQLVAPDDDKAAPELP